MTVKPTSTAKPTATQTVKPTQTPVTDESLFSYTVSDSKATITKYNGSDAVVYIPETLSGHTVTQISIYAFCDNKTIKEVYIPEGITTLAHGAFGNCHNLEKVYMADAVTKIEDSVFSGCNKLYDVRLSKNLIYIGDGSFSHCNNLKTLELPDKLEVIGVGAFSESGITQITIPASVTNADRALELTPSLKHIEVENGNSDYYSIDGVLFKKSGGAHSYLIHYPACKKDSSYEMPATVVIISEWAFSGNKFLKDITLSPILSNIGYQAFSYCTALTTVKTDAIWEQYIADSAFYNCSSLTTLNLEPSVIAIGEDVFYGCPNLTLTVEEGSYAHTYAEKNGIPYILN